MKKSTFASLLASAVLVSAACEEEGTATVHVLSSLQNETIMTFRLDGEEDTGDILGGALVEGEVRECVAGVVPGSYSYEFMTSQGIYFHLLDEVELFPGTNNIHLDMSTGKIVAGKLP